jgi:hypothetical protein
MALVGREDETLGDPIVTSGTARKGNCLEGRINPEKPGMNMHAERGFCKLLAQHQAAAECPTAVMYTKIFLPGAGQCHERRLYCAAYAKGP